jgi:heme exporter protein A
MLEATDLACERGGRILFEKLGVRVAPGTLVRVAGANGIGKTSLLRILCGLAQPSAGSVRWNGKPIASQQEDYWRHLVYVGHLNAIKDDLTVVENLRAQLALAGRSADDVAVMRALAAVGLGEAEARRMARALSQGQRRRAALARLPAGADAALWILDEPFSALDTDGVAGLSRLISEHLARGSSVIMTTHQEVDVAAPAIQRIELDHHAGESVPC